ncbi:mediator of RNA polymerase II transcription subunit 24 isoform X1 [Parasteatoda tepidariorum]
MYTQMLQKHKELEEKLAIVPNTTNVSKEVIESALSLVSSVDNLPVVPSENVSKNKLQTLASTLNIMVGIDAILNPASDASAFVSHLLLVKKLQNFKLSQVYSELIRACLIGIASGTGSFEDDLKWFAFTFLKLPNIISNIQSLQIESEEDSFEKSLDMLLHYSPLLDLTDLKSNSDTLQYLAQEFCKAKIMTEGQGMSFLGRRQNDSFKSASLMYQNMGGVKLPTPKPSPQWDQANIPSSLQAEHTLKTILKLLDSDYSKIQEALLGVLCHILPLRKFKLILAAAAATGKLHTFITKLIECNDFNKYFATENAKAAQTRALTFDVTFLLLFYISQYYGTEIVLGLSTIKDSFFVQWISKNLAEDGKFKCPDLVLSRSDQATVDLLLAQFLNTEHDMSPHQVKWHEVCLNAPAAAREILIAWEHGALSTEKVKLVLDHIKSQMCCLPVCISVWLCNYINVLHHEERLKPMNMLQHFIAPPAVESVTSPSESPSASGRQTPQLPGSEQSNAFYSGRCSLMIGIIKIMMWDLHPPLQLKSKIAPLIPHGLTVKKPLGKILDEVFNDVHYRGWLDIKSIHYFETLLCVGGARWICDALVRRILGYQFLQDINRAVDMVIGIFYLDIEQCALALLLHVLPFYLYSEAHQEQLAEPYGSALSRLTVITTYAALQSRQCSSGNSVKTGCKRSHREVDIDDTRDHTEHSRPTKIHRSNAELLEDTPFELQNLSDEHMRNAVANPINKAIADLMRTLLVIASDATISARSYFPIRFLEQVVLRAKDQASQILQFMPLGLVGLLLKKYPEEFSPELILAVSSMQSPKARKVAALSLCQLTIAQNRLTTKTQCWLDF